VRAVWEEGEEGEVAHHNWVQHSSRDWKVFAFADFGVEGASEAVLEHFVPAVQSPFDALRSQEVPLQRHQKEWIGSLLHSTTTDGLLAKCTIQSLGLLNIPPKPLASAPGSGGILFRHQPRAVQA